MTATQFSYKVPLLPLREKVVTAQRWTDKGCPSPGSAFGLTTLSRKGRGGKAWRLVALVRGGKG